MIVEMIFVACTVGVSMSKSILNGRRNDGSTQFNK